jgi:hypothetical protein
MYRDYDIPIMITKSSKNATIETGDFEIRTGLGLRQHPAGWDPVGSHAVQLHRTHRDVHRNDPEFNWHRPLVVLGWRVVYKRYWSQEEGKGELVTDGIGIYGYIRHPQYTGFLMITLGMLFDWATLPMLIMWPIMAVLYYRLARKEEADMEQEFGQQYVDYKRATGMFLPRILGGRRFEEISTTS